MRRALFALCALAASCADGSSVVTLTLDNSGVALVPIDHFELRVTDKSHSPPRSAGPVTLTPSPQPATLPPPQHFSFTLPRDIRGTVNFAVVAYDTGGAPVATSDADVDVQPSKTTHLTLDFGAAPDMGVGPGVLTPVRVQRDTPKVDLLFLVDNSPSMSPKQAALRARFMDLAQTILGTGAAIPAWYHVGVITSDLGAGPYTLNQGQCHPSGDNGALVAKGAQAAASCQVPTGGVNFIDFNEVTGASNLPGLQTLQDTLTCMASVGDSGCGFEHQLEAVYRALREPPAANHDFLRTDALLAVVFLTDEDDCSAPPDSDLFDPAPANYTTLGNFDSYRCSHWGIQCGSPAMQLPFTATPQFSSCSPLPMASGGKLYDVERYINLFSQPSALGGLKIEPSDVVLASISAPQLPVQVVATQVTPNPVYTLPCPADSGLQNCAPGLAHSCVSTQNVQFFGDPAVRLKTVLKSNVNSIEESICDNDYSPAIAKLTQTITNLLGPACIGAALADPTHPNCVVQDQTRQADGSVTSTPIPACAASVGMMPCWRLVSEPRCPAAPKLNLVIDRGGQPTPPETVPTAACQLAA